MFILPELKIYLQRTAFFCDLPLCLLYTLDDGRSSNMDVDATGAGSTLDLMMRGARFDASLSRVRA
jgi:hypothetical protein